MGLIHKCQGSQLFLWLHFCFKLNEKEESVCWRNDLRFLEQERENVICDVNCLD